MKKNILGALVASFVTLAFLFVLDDITNEGAEETQHKAVVEIPETNEQPDMATLDDEE